MNIWIIDYTELVKVSITMMSRDGGIMSRDGGTMSRDDGIMSRDDMMGVRPVRVNFLSARLLCFGTLS